MTAGLAAPNAIDWPRAEADLDAITVTSQLRNYCQLR